MLEKLKEFVNKWNKEPFMYKRFKPSSCDLIVVSNNNEIKRIVSFHSNKSKAFIIHNYPTAIYGFRVKQS